MERRLKSKTLCALYVSVGTCKCVMSYSMIVKDFCADVRVVPRAESEELKSIY